MGGGRILFTVAVTGRGRARTSADRKPNIRVHPRVSASKKGNVNRIGARILFTVAVTGRGRARTSADRKPNSRVHPRVSASKKGNVNRIGARPETCGVRSTRSHAARFTEL